MKTKTYFFIEQNNRITWIKLSKFLFFFRYYSTLSNYTQTWHLTFLAKSHIIRNGYLNTKANLISIPTLKYQSCQIKNYKGYKDGARRQTNAQAGVMGNEILYTSNKLGFIF